MSEPRNSGKADVGRVIATRELKVEGRRRPAVVSLYAPRQVAEQEWHCSFRVTGMRRPGRAIGGDAIQALALALQGIRVHLDKTPGRYTWLGGEPGNHGFEHTIMSAFGIDHANRMAQLVEQETTRFVEREVRRRRRGRQARE